jgi:hypothetical protein
MDKAGRAVRAAGNAFDELEGTRRRQLDRELDRIDDLHRSSTSDGSDLDASRVDDAGAARLALEA